MSESNIRFLLNNTLVSLQGIDPNMTVLQYLRDERFQSGTKEGCASGDCGACTVVVAELDKSNPKQLSYKSLNACIAFIGSMHGKQLITVEHLKQGAQLHHVQQAMVDNHASQCGFCTPGFVMSAFALHKHNPTPNREEVLEALAGNLCRCTGYRSIIDAALVASDANEPDSFAQFYKQTVEQLTELNKQSHATLSQSGKQYYAPNSVDDLAQHLLTNSNATLVAGATDLGLAVTQNLDEIEHLVYLGNVDALNEFVENAHEFVIGSAVPYSRFTPALANEYHELGEMIERIGSLQIRNSGTLGGNIGNASPIGDMPPALIALDATMILQQGTAERTIAVEDYFVDYKKTVLAESEFIKSVTIPKQGANQHLKLYKISKRIDDDISAVLAAINITLNNDTVSDVRIAFGGMAAIPKRAVNCELALKGQPFNQQTIDNAKSALTQDFTPMTDVRASDSYRMKVAQNLIQKCFIELQNRPVETRVVNYA